MILKLHFPSDKGRGEQRSCLGNREIVHSTFSKENRKTIGRARKRKTEVETCNNSDIRKKNEYLSTFLSYNPQSIHFPTHNNDQAIHTKRGI